MDKRFKARLPRFFLYATLIAALSLTIFVAGTNPASANVSGLFLTSRTCATVNAFVTYDGFSEGVAPYRVVFAVSLLNSPVYGSASQPLKTVTVIPDGSQRYVGRLITFYAVPEGSTISVTAYEIDSAGVQVSPQLPAVTYSCTHRPAKDKQPSNTDGQPNVGVFARVRVSRITMFAAPSFRAKPIGGLGYGAQVNVTAINQRGDWMQVSYKNAPAWIMWRTQANIYGPYAYLPVLPNAEDYTPTPLPQPTATSTASS